MRQQLGTLATLMVGVVMGILAVLVADAHAPKPRMLAPSANSGAIARPYPQASAAPPPLRVLRAGSDLHHREGRR